MFTGIDIITCVIILSGLMLGLIRGSVGHFLDLIGIIAGIFLTSLIFKAPVNLFSKFGIQGNPVELVCFLGTAVFLIFALAVLLDMLRKRVDIKHVVDRIFGIFPGAVTGFIFSSLLFVTMSVSFKSAMEIQQSKLPGYTLKFLPAIYEKTDRMGITLPKMIYLPQKYTEEFNPENQKIRFWKMNFTKFDGFTCMECEGRVKFEGYFLRIGATMVPKFVCTTCGRMSDGCQTYEGFHKLYGSCPVDMAEEKFRFDCGRWTNYRLISPKGLCPVDNKKLKFWDWHPPSTY